MSNPLQRRLHLMPVWHLLAGVLGGVIYADFLILSGIVYLFIAATCIAILWRKSWIGFILVGFFAGLLTHGSTLQRQASVESLLTKQQKLHHVVLTGTVVDTGNGGEGPYLTKVISSNHLPEHVRVLVSLPIAQQTTLKTGDVIKAKGRLETVAPPRNPHEFNRQVWLYRQGANASFSPYRAPERIGVSSSHRPLRLMESWRNKIRTAITLGLTTDSKEAGLIRAVCLGERPHGTSSMIQDFRESGTLHVFAVSGLHIGMVGGIIAALLWFLRLPRWFTICAIILGMAAYAGVTGMRPPSVRAFIMATIFLMGFLLQRKPTLINSLAVSTIIVVLLDGHQLFTPGFQLSYGVLLAIALAAGWWIKIFKPIAEIDPFLPECLLTPAQQFWLEKRRWLRGSLAVSAAAWLGSAPLIWTYFGIVTPIAVIAGIPLMLLVFLILALALTSLALGSLWTPAGYSLNWLNAKLATCTYSTAAAFSKIPGGHYYHHPDNNGKTTVVVFDLPHGGGANLINAGGGVLIDSGRADTFRRHVMPTLTALRVKPDSLVITHADAKHAGAMTRCLDFYSIKQAIVPVQHSRSASYRHFLHQSQSLPNKPILPHTGQRMEIEPGVHMEILHAPAELDGTGPADDYGLVIRLHCHGWRILFTGDAGYSTEERLLATVPDLRSDVIVMGRNRHDFTGSLSFYQAVKPMAVISSHADFPEYERITASWQAGVESVGAHVFNQGKTGAVSITLDSRSLTLTPTLPSTPSITLTRQ